MGWFGYLDAVVHGGVMGIVFGEWRVIACLFWVAFVLPFSCLDEILEVSELAHWTRLVGFGRLKGTCT